jgi:hypothetical protein
MAKMYGKLRVYPECRYGCCIYEQDKEKSKRLETELWNKDYEDELIDIERDEEFLEAHAIGICKNPKGGYGCDRCYDDSDGSPEDLDRIEGVTTNMERL